MKQGEIKSIIHDLIKFENWKNPLQNIWSKTKVEFNLITGEFNVNEEDSIIEYCKEKRKWFLDRIKKLKGNIQDFKEVKITIFGAKESISITYKEKVFKEEMIYGQWMEDQKSLKKALKKLKPFDTTKKK